jgi:hypothetical protein
MIHGGTTVRNFGCTGVCVVLGRVRHIQSGALSVFAEESPAANDLRTNMSHAYVFPVNAGVNTFDIRLSRFGGNGTLQGWFAELAAIYTPFGSTGAGTLGTAAADTATATAKDE